MGGASAREHPSLMGGCRPLPPPPQSPRRWFTAPEEPPPHLHHMLNPSDQSDQSGRCFLEQSLADFCFCGRPLAAEVGAASCLRFAVLSGGGGRLFLGQA